MSMIYPDEVRNDLANLKLTVSELRAKYLEDMKQIQMKFGFHSNIPINHEYWDIRNKYNAAQFVTE